MAKTSMVEREKRRAKLVAKYADKRAELKAIIKNPEHGRPDACSGQASEIAAQFEPGSHAEPVRPVGTAARVLPQIRSGAEHAAQGRHAW